MSRDPTYEDDLLKKEKDPYKVVTKNGKRYYRIDAPSPQYKTVYTDIPIPAEKPPTWKKYPCTKCGGKFYFRTEAIEEGEPLCRACYFTIRKD